MAESTTPVELAERVATVASGLGIETTLIGAYALAAYDYVRGTADIDLGTAVPLDELRRLESALEAEGLQTKLRTPDAEDPLGGVLVVWEHADDDGEPVEPVEVVNFLNPFRPRKNPAATAIANAISLEGKPALRYPRIEDLIALKLDAGSRRDEADVVDLLVANPGADRDAIRARCRQYGFDQIDVLIAEAQAELDRRSM